MREVLPGGLASSHVRLLPCDLQNLPWPRSSDSPKPCLARAKSSHLELQRPAGTWHRPCLCVPGTGPAYQPSAHPSQSLQACCRIPSTSISNCHLLPPPLVEPARLWRASPAPAEEQQCSPHLRCPCLFSWPLHVQWSWKWRWGLWGGCLLPRPGRLCMSIRSNSRAGRKATPHLSFPSPSKPATLPISSPTP